MLYHTLVIYFIDKTPVTENTYVFALEWRLIIGHIRTYQTTEAKNTWNTKGGKFKLKNAFVYNCYNQPMYDILYLVVVINVNVDALL